MVMTALEDFARHSGKIYVGGRLESSRATEHLDVIDPATEERIGGIADTTDAEVDHAIDLATPLDASGWASIHAAVPLSSTTSRQCYGATKRPSLNASRARRASLTRNPSTRSHGAQRRST